ncbi:MAG: SDR family oxidoreductase [Sphingomonadaceae bacterium]
MTQSEDSTTHEPPFAQQQQAVPGTTQDMDPQPDHGETSYSGSSRLTGKKAIITGADSGIGRAVAIAFAREGADVLVAYLDEDQDAQYTRFWVEKAGRKCVLVRGDLSKPDHCDEIVAEAQRSLGGIDLLVNNAAHQMTFKDIDSISDEEWQRTFAVNIHAMFYLTKRALAHMPDGGAIINTASINSDDPNPTLLPYATTKGAIQNYTAGLAQLLADRRIRVNCVAPGPVWTPLIPSTMPEEKVAEFGKDYPLGRPAQPAEVAPPYVLLASEEASYISGATVAVTGGKPMI